MRYAVYWAPPAGSALARFGAEWLGWDAAAGGPGGPLAVAGLPCAWEEIVGSPRRYGFHATLKAPFRLAPGRDAAELGAAVGRLAAGRAAFRLPRLALSEIGDFLALTPEAESPELQAVAAACVTELDGFRGAMEPGERARRAAGLDARGRALLDRWGYPHVFERFRFHLTLSGPLGAAERAATTRALCSHLAPLLEESQPFQELCLFAAPPGEPFRIVGRHRLGGTRWSG